MRIMAIDYGDARTGVAISDMMCMLAGESFVIADKSFSSLADKLCDAVKTHDIAEIALGYPKNMNGTVGERGMKSERLASVLRERLNIPVVLWDERRTTADAHRILSETGRHGKQRKERIDAVAAALILEGYLVFRKSKELT